MVRFHAHTYPTIRVCVCVCTHMCSVMPDSLWPMNCSPPGSSVHGILPARILKWVAISSSRVSSPPRDQTHVSFISCHWQADSLPPHHQVSPAPGSFRISQRCLEGNSTTQSQELAATHSTSRAQGHRIILGLRVLLSKTQREHQRREEWRRLSTIVTTLSSFQIGKPRLRH